MATAARAIGATLTIGDVLAQLKPEHPSLTISKIRFLEDEGLVRPQRTPAGYRKFTSADVARLRYVLVQQRDHYLPLRVIKEQLEAIDRGEGAPSEHGPVAANVVVADLVDNAPTPDTFRPSSAGLRLSQQELCNTAGLRVEQLRELEQHGLITPRAGGVYDDHALAVARVAAELSRFGLEGRHLRGFRTAAEREVGLLSQVVGPMSRQRGNQAKARAEEAVRELAALSVQLHVALVQAALHQS